MQKFTKEFESDLPDVDYYILKYDDEKQKRLQSIRNIMKETYPNSTERIYYGIPTVDLDGQIILQYAAYKKHISMIICTDLSRLLQEKYPQYNYTDYTVLFLDKEPFPDEFVSVVCGLIEKVYIK